MKRLFLIMSILTVSIAASARDLYTVTYKVQPQMHCENCKKKIKDQLKFEKGVRAINISIKEQTVKLTYDADKTDTQKLSESLKKIGYKTTEIDNKKLNLK